MPTASVRSKESGAIVCMRRSNPLVHGLTSRLVFHPSSIHMLDNKNGHAMDELPRLPRIGSRLHMNRISGIEP